MADSSVMLAIGAAGAFHRAGLPFPLPPRWEADQGDWSDDDRVREAFGAESDAQAERILRKRIKDAKLTRAAELVVKRRYQEVALGVREDDSMLARLARALHDGVEDYLLPAAIKKAFDKFERETQATIRDLADRFGIDELRPEDVLEDTDARIDAELERAGYRISSQDDRQAVSITADLAPMVDIGGGLVTLAPIVPGMAAAEALERGAKLGFKSFGKGPGGTLLKAGAEIGNEARQPGMTLGVGIAIGAAAVIALLIIARS